MVRVNYDNLPEDLKRRGRFAPFKTRPRPGHPEKTDKIPFDANGKALSTQAPERWLSWDDAELAFASNRHYAGIGLLMEPDKWAGADFDRCIKNGVLDPEVAQRMHDLGGFHEKSISGTGAHVIGTNPEDFRGEICADGVELYLGLTPRFIALTGVPIQVNGAASQLGPLNPEPLAQFARVAAQAPGSPAPTPGNFASVAHIFDMLPVKSRRQLEGQWTRTADRSRAVQRIACEALGLGASPEDVFTLLVNCDGSHQVALEHRRGKTDKASGYLWKHVTDAAAKVVGPVEFEDLEPAKNRSDLLRLTKPKGPSPQDIINYVPADFPYQDLSDAPVMQGIYQWMYARSQYPHPDFLLVATFAAVAAVLGSARLTPDGQTCSLYTILLGYTGAGKDSPQQRLKDLLIDHGLASRLGGNAIVSQAGIEEALKRSRELIFTVDEIGRALQANNAGNDTNNVMGALLALFSASGSSYPTRSLAKSPSVLIPHPSVSVFGGSTPDALRLAVSAQHVEIGWLGRLLLIRDTMGRPPHQDPDPKLKIATEIGDWIREVGCLSLLEPDPFYATWEPDAKAWLDGLRIMIDDFIAARADATTLTDEILRNAFVRVIEITKRLACTSAWTRDYANARVTLRDMQRAAYIVVRKSSLYVVTEMAEQITGGVAGEDGQRLKAVLDLVKAVHNGSENGQTWQPFAKGYAETGAIPLTYIYRRTNLKKPAVLEICETLHAQGAFVFERHISEKREVCRILPRKAKK